MNTLSPTQQEIAVRAYHIYLEKGCPHGNAWEHWFQAEKELGTKFFTPPAAKAPAAQSSNGSVPAAKTAPAVTAPVAKKAAKKAPAKKEVAAKKAPAKKSAAKK